MGKKVEKGPKIESNECPGPGAIFVQNRANNMIRFIWAGRKT